MIFFYHKIHKLGGKVFHNSDGHEWIRAKWFKQFLNIEKYIHEFYDVKESKTEIRKLHL